MKSLNVNGLEEASYVRSFWAVTLEVGTPLEAVLDPAFWAHVARRLRPLDRIEVRAEDGSFWAELIVLASGDVTARVQILNSLNLESSAPIDDDEDYEVKWAGPTHKYRIMRLKDKAIIKTGLTSKEDAYKSLGEHKKAMAA